MAGTVGEREIVAALIVASLAIGSTVGGLGIRGWRAARRGRHTGDRVSAGDPG